MKKIIKTKSFKILIITIIISLIAIIYTSNTFPSLFSSGLGFILTPIQQITNSGVKQVQNNLPNNSKSYSELLEENALLQEKLNEMINKTVDYYDLKRENEEFFKYLDLKKQNNEYEFAAADIIGRDPAELFYGFTINQGSLSDISLYDPVITEKGLVGWVSAVYPNYSKVTTILSPETNVSVIDQVSLDNGILTGNLISMQEMNTQMKFISAQNKIEPGDIVVTSGMGGVYPPKLPVGEVIGLHQREGDKDIVASIKPYNNINDINYVFVITNFAQQGNKLPDTSE